MARRKPDVVPTRTVTVNGHRVTFRSEYTGRDLVLMASGRTADAVQYIANRVVSHGFEGEILDQSLKVINAIGEAFNSSDEDDAVPPE